MPKRRTQDEGEEGPLRTCLVTREKGDRSGMIRFVLSPEGEVTVVSFIAEPTPALSRGSEPMIDSVAGAIARAMPRSYPVPRLRRSAGDRFTTTLRLGSCSPALAVAARMRSGACWKGRAARK